MSIKTTILLLFAGFDGSVYDYFFGYEDLQKRRVAFVGDPDVRVKEDYLRIMRYFRFYGKIADKPDNHEEQTLKVLKDNVEGLQNISGERIWVELKKMLQGNFAGSLLKTMIDVGVGQYIGNFSILTNIKNVKVTWFVCDLFFLIGFSFFFLMLKIITGLPSSPNVDELNRVLKRADHLQLHPMSYLAALLLDIDEVTVLHNRLKFSGYERDLTYFLVEHRDDKVGSRPLL